VNVYRGYSTTGMTAASSVTRYDKLNQKEIKDLLLCFLYIVRNLSEGMPAFRDYYIVFTVAVQLLAL